MDGNSVFGSGFGFTLFSFFMRYAVKEMPPWVARTGVGIGLLMMLSSASSSRPSLTNGPFLMFLAGCLWIAGSILWEYASPRNEVTTPLVRHLSDDQKSRLMAEAGKVRQMIPSILVIHVNGDPESELYARDFIDTFRRAGITAAYGWTAPDGPDQVGVLIAVADPRTPPVATARLHDALKTIGIDANTIAYPKAGIGIGDPSLHPFALYVAPRPL
jgi:hypothetical protein